jgi:hypothetical protein
MFALLIPGFGLEIIFHRNFPYRPRTGRPWIGELSEPESVDKEPRRVRRGGFLEREQWEQVPAIELPVGRKRHARQVEDGREDICHQWLKRTKTRKTHFGVCALLTGEQAWRGDAP